MGYFLVVGGTQDMHAFFPLSRQGATMKRLSLAGQFLRRSDTRKPVRCGGIIECRGISRTITIIDFSNLGLRIDHLTGLVAGDRVTISFTPQLVIEGTIAWLVWHKAGMRFLRPLTVSDPIHIYLTSEASKFSVARVRAVSALAQQDASRVQADRGA